MPITVTCRCGRTSSYRDEYAGSLVKCKGCGTVSKIPSGTGGAGGTAPAGTATSVANPASATPPLPNVAQTTSAALSDDERVVRLLDVLVQNTATLVKVTTNIMWLLATPYIVGAVALAFYILATVLGVTR